MFNVSIINGRRVSKDFEDPTDAIDYFYSLCELKEKSGVLTLTYNNLVKWQYDLKDGIPNYARWISKVDLYKNFDDKPNFVVSDYVAEKFNIAKRRIGLFTARSSDLKRKENYIEYYDFVRDGRNLYLNLNTIRKLEYVKRPKIFKEKET